MDKDVYEIGGKAIYEFRGHPKRTPWEKTVAETRASYRARMQELINELASAGYTIVKRGKDKTKEAK